MSEGGEKTELPTPKKERDARAKGQVARSQELVTTASLLGVVAYVWVTFPGTVTTIVSMLDAVAADGAQDFHTRANVAIEAVARGAVSILAPLLLVTIVVGIAANYLQIGSLFALQGITPSLSKISPASGFKRIFSKKQLVEILKALLKIAALAVVVFGIVREAMGAYVVGLPCGMPCLAGITAATLAQILASSALVFIVVAVADLAWQRYSHTKELMMTKDEVKREYKESEGDPHVKGHRRQLAFELVMGDGGHAQKKPTALVVNPTHIAVAILYEPPDVPLPLVIDRARGDRAVRLRAAAEEAGVPVFRHVKLARGLYAAATPQGEVPDEWLQAVAEILAWVERHRDRLYQQPLGHGVLDIEDGDHRSDLRN
ncbi:type III secretion system export apparatus subunit SctU [Alsobacter sp. SYSU M60028]|uniref:Type III secretion system export apparatus subunit SctU n=1 Tax=Alsobacter ponti TaxID=2962936 RepID=A0ABT1LDD9_9HYPH|nr:type III secretion system export apparatus subunit SctU [Alsobacter ponti]